MPNPYSSFIVDPATGQTIQLPSQFSSYMGLPQASPIDLDPVYPPESGGDDSDFAARVAGIHQTPSDPSTVQSAADAVRFAAQWHDSANRRAALPANVRDGSYYTDDISELVPPMSSPGYARPAAPGNPLLAQLAHPRTDVARIGQSTGPIGTINQIGSRSPLDYSSAAMHGGYATQSDLDAYNRDQALAIPPRPQAPIDPNNPELTGNNLALQGFEMQENAARASADADARQAYAEAEMRRRAEAEADRVRQETARQQALMQKRYDEIQTDVTKRTNEWADYKIDPSRKWRNASTGQKIGAALAIAMTALGDALQYKSGPNGALQIIQQAINDDVDQQIRERQNLGEIASRARSSLDDYRQEYGDWRLAREAKLAEVWTRFASDTEAQMAATRGDKARANGLALVGAARQQAAAHQQNVASAVSNRELQQKKFDVEQRQNQQQLGLAWANHKLNRDQFDWQKEYQQKNLDLEAQKLAAAGKGKAAQQVAELGVAAPPQTVADADGNITVQRGGVLTQSDGTPFAAPTKEEAIEVRKKVGAANNLVAIIDEIRAIRDRVGGESSWNNSDDYQRLQVLKSQLLLTKKQGTQGMSSDKDFDVIVAGLGAKDPASFRAQMAGLDEGRNQIVQQVNSDLHNQYGYTGPDIKWADPVKATKAAPDEQFKDLLKNPMEEASKDPKKWNALAKDLGVEKEILKNPTGGGAAQIMANALDKRDGLAPSAQRTLDGYADVLRDPSANAAAKAQAREKLATASTSSKSVGVKMYARQLLAGEATANAKLTPETIDQPATSTARDTSYGGPAQTLAEQQRNDAVKANIARGLPLAKLLEGVKAGDTISIAELSKRAMSSGADPATKAAYVKWIGTRVK